MNNATVIASKPALTNLQAVFWGGLIAGVLDATDDVFCLRHAGFEPVQVLQQISNTAIAALHPRLSPA